MIKVKRDDKLFVALAISVFLISAFLLSFINNSVVTGNAITGKITTNFISDLFTNWGAGQLDLNIAKYLFLLMLTGLIWGALSFAKFPKYVIFQGLIAIPIAFLATAYITPEEVFTILQSYTALGITLTFVLPFMIMIFVSAMLVSSEKSFSMSPAKILLEIFLWLFFVAILGYKIVFGLVTGSMPFGLNLTIGITLAVFIISSFILFFNKRFVKWLWKIDNRIRMGRAIAERIEAVEAVKTGKAVAEAREKKVK